MCALVQRATATLDYVSGGLTLLWELGEGIKFLYLQHQPLLGILPFLLWGEFASVQREGDVYQAGGCCSLP